ncbi:hypothetical protein ACVR1I_01185 [Streptococcus cameli]
MVKWQKKVAVIGLFCLLAGFVAIGLGLLMGGAKDVKRIYMTSNVKEEIKTHEFKNVERFDLDLSGLNLLIEEAEVEFVTVVETQVETESYQLGDVKAINEKGVLSLKNEQKQQVSSEVEINTDILSILKEFRTFPVDKPYPVVVQVPKGLDLKEVRLRLHSGSSLSTTGLHIQELVLDSVSNSSITISEKSLVDSISGQVNSSSFYLNETYIKSGELFFRGEGSIGLLESRLENLDLEVEDISYIYMMENQLKDSRIKVLSSDAYPASTLSLEGMVYLGQVEIETKNIGVSLFELETLEQTSFDLKAEKERIMIDVKQVPRTAIEDEKISTYQYDAKESQATVVIRTKNAPISLRDIGEEDSRPEWAYDESPDFSQFEKE